MPILFFLSNFLGQPVVITFVPAQIPKIEFQAPTPAKTSDAEPAGCRYIICKA